MRREWRNVLVAWLLFLFGTSSAAAQPASSQTLATPGDQAVRLTAEINWAILRDDADATTGRAEKAKQDCVLELTEGRLVDVIEWPPVSLSSEGGPRDRGTGAGLETAASGGRTWRSGARASGRVRARIEAPLDAGLVVRAGDQVVNIPLIAILERAQRTPPQSHLMVSVERLAWDSLSIDLGEANRDGIVAPGAQIPVSVAYNIIWPESTDVSVKVSGVLRPSHGGDVLWRIEPREVVAANRREPAKQIWNLRAPPNEGTYVLEVQASWEPVGAREGSRLSRLIRRRKPAAVANSSVRKVTFTVIDPMARETESGRGRETEVDSIDLARTRSYRPLAAGRSPAAEPGRFAWAVPGEALIEPSRRDRLRGWFMRNGVEASKLEPADGSGLAWTAVGLKVSHPDRPHRLALKVRGGEPSALGVAVVEAAGGPPGSASRLLLDACASGPPIIPGGSPAAFNWLVWPGSSEMVLILVNRSSDAVVHLGNVTLTELDELSAAPAAPEPAAAARTLGLYLSGLRSLEPFGAQAGFSDPLLTARNLTRYLRFCGAQAVVLPAELADRSARQSLDGQADEDSTRPDRLETARRILARQGYSLWLELGFDGPESLPGLPAVGSAEALRRGLVRVDREGRADGPAYHPLNPEVREAMKRRVAQALASVRGRAGETAGAAAPGLMIRLGPGPTLLGTPDTGLDDVTFDRFVRETFKPETARDIPGSGNTDPERFAVRSHFLAGVGRMPWLTWRSQAIAALYRELSEAAHATDPGATLAVVTPGLDNGPSGGEARRIDRAGLAPSQAWRSVGLDLPVWSTGPATLPVLRGVSLATDALAHDLATSPDLDALVAARPRRGLLLSIDGDQPAMGSLAAAATTEDLPMPASSPAASGAAGTDAGGTERLSADESGRNPSLRTAGAKIWLTAMPLGDGAAADEPLGHAIAALDAQWLFLEEKAVAGQEERVRRFARVLRALPAWPGVPGDRSPRPFGVAVRRMNDETQTFLEIANDSPYPVRVAGVLEAPDSALVEDMGRGLRLLPAAEAGERKLVFDLIPYGVAAIRVGAPRAVLSSVSSFPSDAVRAGMKAQFNELSLQYARLNRGLVASALEPANPGFEPESDSAPASVPPAVKAATPGPTTRNEGDRSVLGGWHVERNSSDTTTIAIDREHPHSGQGSLRITAPAAPAAVASDVFAPNVQSNLTIQAYFRASVAGAKVRVWIEGESAGKPYIRRTEITVGTEWEPVAVRASDVPAAGLDSARLRFELITPGVVWIDDLQIPGEAQSKSTRLNAQRTLLAALQAYREERYADFARLAGSHWLRESSMAAPRLARSTGPPAKPGDDGSRSPAGEPSALSPERKLR